MRTIMATIREATRNVINEARDGIGWIALWKEGRGWESAVFWPDYDEQADCLAFSEDDLPEILEITEKDSDAIIVNGWIYNLGPVEDATVESLATALRWQRELHNARIIDYIQPRHRR